MIPVSSSKGKSLTNFVLKYISESKMRDKLQDNEANYRKENIPVRRRGGGYSRKARIGSLRASHHPGLHFLIKNDPKNSFSRISH